MQLDALVELGYRTVSLQEIVDWLAGHSLAERSVLITFDDAFGDFAKLAWPELCQRGLGATVFVPTGYVGKHDEWEDRAGHIARPLLTWNEVNRLASEGVEFGGHTVNHEDLTMLSAAESRQEIESCKYVLEQQIGRDVIAFAPPFGRTNVAVRATIGETYKLSFGTILRRATRQSDPYELPRIEMHYFRNQVRWRSHLLGGGGWRLAARRALRTVRQSAAAISSGASH
jgi:peptidoglycan/xylan/chitin deacetylase (PgdA/CDA1 family)